MQLKAGIIRSREVLGNVMRTIWKFVDCLKREHASMHLKIAQYIAGVVHPPQSRRYRDLNARILTVTRGLCK